MDMGNRRSLSSGIKRSIPKEQRNKVRQMEKTGVWSGEINQGSNSDAVDGQVLINIFHPVFCGNWISQANIWYGSILNNPFPHVLFWITVPWLKNLRSLGNGILLFHGFLSYLLSPKLKQLRSDQVTVLELSGLWRGFVACISHSEFIIRFRETLSLLQNTWAPSRVWSTGGLIT